MLVVMDTSKVLIPWCIVWRGNADCQLFILRKTKTLVNTPVVITLHLSVINLPSHFLALQVKTGRLCIFIKKKKKKYVFFQAQISWCFSCIFFVIFWEFEYKLKYHIIHVPHNNDTINARTGFWHPGSGLRVISQILWHLNLFRSPIFPNLKLLNFLKLRKWPSEG